MVHGALAMDDDMIMDDDDDNVDDESDDKKGGYNVVDEDGSVKLLSSTTEFKIDGSNERMWLQMFANMARVAGTVFKVWIFGVNCLGLWTFGKIPMLYEVNFNTNEAHFYIGVDMHFSNCLALVSLKMMNS